MPDPDHHRDALRALGIDTEQPPQVNLQAPSLYEATLRQGSGRIGAGGPMVVDTTPYTGRSPKDKFIVREPGVEDDVAWGKVNQEIAPGAFDALYDRVTRHLSAKELFVQDLWGGAEPSVRLSVRLVTENPWAALFARNLLIAPDDESQLTGYAPEFTIVHAPSFKAEP